MTALSFGRLGGGLQPGRARARPLAHLLGAVEHVARGAAGGVALGRLRPHTPQLSPLPLTS